MSNLFALYRACLRNAEQLLEEAQLLLEHHHRARAYALAFTAYEEIGKSQIVADHLNGLVSESEYRKAFRDHTMKAAYVVRQVQLPEGSVIYDPKAFKAHWNLRLSSLYVERGENDAPLTPHAAVSEEDVDDIISAVQRELDAIEHAEWLNDRIGTKGLFK